MQISAAAKPDATRSKLCIKAKDISETECPVQSFQIEMYIEYKLGPFQQKVMIHRGQATPAVSGPTQLQDGGQRADSIGRNRPWLEGWALEVIRIRTWPVPDTS